MNYGCLQCELCRRSYAEEQVHKVKYDFSVTPPQIAGVVPEYYQGIRVICHFCVEGIRALPHPGPAASAARSAGSEPPTP